MSKPQYIVVQDWMASELGLSGNELLVYAMIYGFSQDGESMMYGSYAYIARFLNVSKRHIIRIIKELEKSELIIKLENANNEISPNSFKHNPKALNRPVTRCHQCQKVTSDKMSLPSDKMSLPPSDKIAPNNNILDNNIDNNISTLTNVKVQTPKTSRKSKYSDDEKNLHAVCFDTWKRVYLELFNDEYYWTAKDAKGTIDIIKQIKSKMGDDKNNITAVNSNFEVFLRALANKADKFTLEHFYPSYIASQFNQLYLKLKNNGNTTSGGASVSTEYIANIIRDIHSSQE